MTDFSARWDPGMDSNRNRKTVRSYSSSQMLATGSESAWLLKS